jgi:alkanesulfonate monooxygenase SsuD/methylene tetrahydromethanopterin reductase-like flavin-dependent oxidoreductase (luciferase family)
MPTDSRTPLDRSGRVEFGVHLGQQDCELADLRRLWTWLDANGADWISVWDHLYEAPSAGGTHPHYEAVALLGALAADTSNARLGCLVFCASYRNIGMLAKSAVTIDHLAGGRFELGIGSGWYDEEATAFGLHFPSPRQRSRIMQECVEVLRAWRAGERVNRRGPDLALVDAAMLPSPAGPLPIWIGGVGRKVTLRIAGALADGWNAAYIGAPEFRELNGVLDEWCEHAGRAPADVARSINLNFSLSDQDPATARAELERRWGEHAARVRDGSLLGRPADVAEQIAPYVEAGASLVNIVIRPPWDDDILEAYLNDVVPAMRKEWTSPSGLVGASPT